MEVLFPLAFQNLQGWNHNNWKKKEQKGFVTIVIEKNTQGHKCAKKKLFYIDCEEVEEKEQET